MRRSEHERLMREKDREVTYLRQQNDALLDKLLHVTGKTWTPPPKDMLPEPEPEAREHYSWAPEQEFDTVLGIE